MFTDFFMSNQNSEPTQIQTQETAEQEYLDADRIVYVDIPTMTERQNNQQ